MLKRPTIKTSIKEFSWELKCNKNIFVLNVLVKWQITVKLERETNKHSRALSLSPDILLASTRNVNKSVQRTNRKLIVNRFEGVIRDAIWMRDEPINISSSNPFYDSEK